MQLYNTMTRQKEEFVPLVPGEVKMYSCGPTVYNYFHIGNARPFIVFDTLRRYFRYLGYKVNFVQNFTDVDDKLINRAVEEDTTVPQLAEKYIEAYFEDAGALGIERATHHPRATENIDAIIELVASLIEKGYAYEVDGDVYFSTKKFESYGKLSHQPLDELVSGARISVDERKEDPLDFALWKKRKVESEIAWESPWGMGRPGWHIECSAMAGRFLGETIDIHSGGKDLIFPHHENEIAQSECAHNGAPFARYWLHNGYINIDNVKMSKSKGNFFTVRDITAKYDPEVVRFFMLSAHYRSPINFSDELMAAAKTGLDRLYTVHDRLASLPKGDGELPVEIAEKKQKFLSAMDDDLNTADAIAALFEMGRSINILLDKGNENVAGACLAVLEELAGILGILSGRKEEEADEEVEALIAERQAARKAKDFGKADAIRAQLLEKGIVLEDTREGVKWHRI
ncbi:MAG: cysteine--tRNA ligase [Ruminococcaceae bacterium]|nr:cysteine--tRNA ligase [Oscillospiraceae bacterium]